MDAVSIKVSGLSKFYHLYNSPGDRLKEALNPFKKNYHHDFFALKEVDFEVKRGEVIGIVGNNGAGKSTLLKILTGVLTPSQGEVKVEGKIASLLELGAGFNPEYTGIENIYFQGTLMGYTNAQMREKIDEIIAFADIGEFIDQPVHMYSSGMFARLAFAVATSVKPDILIIDEALSVGDGAFAHKSFNRIMQLKDEGTTVVFCSHTLYQVEMICSKVLWLHEGSLHGWGKASDIVKAYDQFLYKSNNDELNYNTSSETTQTPLQSMRFTSIKVLVDDKEAGINEVVFGKSRKSNLSIEMHWKQDMKLPPPSLGITIHAMDGRMVGSAGTHFDGIETICNLEGQGKATVSFESLILLKGEYKIEAYLMCEKGILFYDQIMPVARFKIIQAENDLEQGLVHLSRKWKI